MGGREGKGRMEHFTKEGTAGRDKERPVEEKVKDTSPKRQKGGAEAIWN